MSSTQENSLIRVLLLSEPASGGVRRHLVDLLSALDFSAFEVELLYGASRTDTAFCHALPELERRWQLVPLSNLQRSISWRDIPAFFSVFGAILRFRPHVVHCHSSKAGVLGRFAAWLARVPVILYTPHCYSFLLPDASPRSKAFYGGIERMFCRLFTSKVIHVSQGERKQAASMRIGPAERLTVVYNGLPPLINSNREAARKALAAGEREYLVGVAARLDAQKNPHLFFEIASRVCARHQNVRFCWLGDGPLLDEIRQKAAAAGLADRIVFYGYRDDAPALTEGFDLYLLTSHCEGLPYGLLEAARAGIPMVATRVTGNDEVIRDGINGYLFSEAEPGEGAARITEILTDAPFSRVEIQRDFESRFSLAGMVEQLSELYRGK